MNDIPTDKNEDQVISREHIETNDSCIVQHSQQIHTYMVTREQLEQFREKASAGNDELAFGTFLASIGLTAIATLLSTTIVSFTINLFFCAAAIFGPIFGGFYLIKWWINSRKRKTCIDDILNAPEEKRRKLR